MIRSSPRTAARRREETKVVKVVRPKVERRDGYCRLGKHTALFGHCAGPSHWSHLKGHQRHETRRRPPEERHTTVGSAMLCEWHHEGPDGYDQHGFDIEAVDPTRGADGPLRYVGRAGRRYEGVVYEEEA